MGWAYESGGRLAVGRLSSLRILRALALSVVAALLLPAVSPALAPLPGLFGSAKADLVPSPLIPGNPAFRADPDGARTFTGVIEDDPSGILVHRLVYDHVAEANGPFAVSTAQLAYAIAFAAACASGVCAPVPPGTFAALTGSALTACADNGLQPVCYTGPHDTTVDRMGLYASDWTYDGAPMTTIGVFVDTTSDGRLRFPIAIVENAPGLSASLDPVYTLLLQDGVAPASAALPFVAQWAVPGSFAWPVAAGALILAGALAFAGVFIAFAAPFLVPATGAPVQAQLLAAWSTWFPYAALPGGLFLFMASLHVGFSLLLEQTGPWQGSLFWAEYQDRPDIYVWTSRKLLDGHDLFTGNYLARDGAYAATGTYCLDFAISGWKTDVLGVAHRLDHATSQDAGVVIRHDSWMTCANGIDWDGGDRVSVGVEVAGVRQLIAGVDMQEGKTGFGLYPVEQTNDIRVGVYAAGAFVPLVGSRTEATNVYYTDTTNDGLAVPAIEHQRTTSLGVWATGEYVPVWGARYDGERNPPDLWAAQFAAGGVLFAPSGVGDQNLGDWELSTGVFVLGAYTPVTGVRYDDEVDGHHYAYRATVSWGLYPLGTYTPLAAVTYDGEQLMGACCAANVETFEYLVTAGTFVGGAYVPIVGMWHRTTAPDGTRAVQQSYQVGVFAASYAAFIPLVVAAYDGDQTVAVWAVSMPATSTGTEGDWDAQLGSSTPVSGYTPLVGLRYRQDSPTQASPQEAFLLVGVYANGAFTPLVGASLASDTTWIVAPPTPPTTGDVGATAAWATAAATGTVRAKADVGPAALGYDPVVCTDMQAPTTTSVC